MPQIRLRNFLVTVLLGTWCIPAHAQTLYRLARIIADPPSAASLIARDLNDRGQVVGRGWADGAPNAFAWRNGVATNLQPLIDPDSAFTDATGTNNHSDAVGNFVDSQSGLFTGFLLRRGERVIRIEGLPSAASTFVSDINNRRQVIGVSYDAADHMYAFLWERGNITPLPPLQGDTSAVPNRINDRGVVVGVSAERAVIWRNGRVRDLGLPGSRGLDINNRGQVVGTTSDENGDHVFVWWRGQVTLLPAIGADSLFAEPRGINDIGEIVGTTFFSDSIIATLWVEGVAVDVNQRIAADDPLRAFVTLETAELINDRSEIVATGRDSRTPNRINVYFLTPVL